MHSNELLPISSKAVLADRRADKLRSPYGVRRAFDGPG